MSVPLKEAVRALDALLEIERLPDYGNALNGLQLEAGEAVSRVALAVDASEEVIEMAIAEGCQLLAVHHGIFWMGLSRLQGPFGRKIRKAYEGGLSIYSAHLPLDVHPEVGNNVTLAGLLGLKPVDRFCDYKGLLVGLLCEYQGEFEALTKTAEKVLGQGIKAWPGPGGRARKVALITGGAGELLEEAKKAGADVFITGEGSHWTVPLAKEQGIGLIYGGHYATEQFGVQALGRWMAANFDVSTVFLDSPTGL